MDDPLVFDYMPSWPVAEIGKPGVTVCALSTTAEPGRHGPVSVTPLRVTPDFAGDLSWQAQAFACPAAAGRRRVLDRFGVLEWHVGAIGFTEAEALDALNFVLGMIGKKAA